MTDLQIRKVLEVYVKRASKVLGLTNLKIMLEPVGKRFKGIENASEFDRDTIYVNRDWAEDRLSNDLEQEVRVIIYHEVRHAFQFAEINKMKNDLPTLEPQGVVEEWNIEYSNYIRNDGQNDILSYYKQSIEIDAIAFGIILLHVDRINGEIKDDSLRSIPDEIDSLLRDRIQILKNQSLNWGLVN